MRMTRQKKVILDIVRRAHHHPTAQDVFEEARKIIASISLATVYRNLEQLSEAGLIRKVVLSDQVARYDCNTGAHYHIRCIGCGRVDDLPFAFHDDLEERIARSVGYVILDHHLEVRGLCPACTDHAKQPDADKGIASVVTQSD